MDEIAIIANPNTFLLVPHFKNMKPHHAAISITSTFTKVLTCWLVHARAQYPFQKEQLLAVYQK